MIDLARPRYGHFDLGTGYHGNVWLDLDALFARPASLRPQVRALADRLREHRVDAVCGPMEGGAFLAYALADLLGVAFLPAFRASSATGYRLAWTGGAGAGIGGWRVAIADDAVNAGTAVRACARELRDQGAVPVAVAALLAVGPANRSVGALSAVGPANRVMVSALSVPVCLADAVESMGAVPFYAVDGVESRAWLPGDCLLCADGVPLTGTASAD